VTQDDSSHSGRDILVEAATWYERLNRADVSEDDFVAFESWVTTPAHRAAYDQVESVSIDVEEQREALGAALRAHGAANVLSFRRRTVSQSLMGWAAAAIAAVAVAGVVVPRLTAPWTSYETPKGGAQTVHLADGTTMVVNTASSLRVSFGLLERKVVIAEGEVSFAVARDMRPLLIEVGGRTVRDIGTEFSVLYHEKRTIVTVRDGIVAVADKTGLSERLVAGDQLVLVGTDAARRKVDADAAFAWQSGRLVYSETKLGDIVSDLNRYFSRPISVTGPAADYAFSGVLALDSEDRVVQRLQAFLPVQKEERDGAIRLIAKKED
jgi:transmembrane sensor